MKKSRVKQKRKERNREKRIKHRSFFKKLALFILFILIILILWGKFIEPNKLTIHDYKIIDNNLPVSFNGFRVIHVTDIHYGVGFNFERLEKLVKSINELEPDIVVFTGDLVDRKYNATEDVEAKLIDYLKSINSKYGKYAIKGNHDYEYDNYDKTITSAGFKLLKNGYDTIYNESNESIVLYGFDDVMYGSPKTDELKNKTIKDIKYKIVLLHEPDYIDKFLNDHEISIVLSGHSHNGQINIPVLKRLVMPEGCRTYYNPYYEVDNTPVYISNGVGNTIVDFRLFNKPSINLYRIYQK